MEKNFSEIFTKIVKAGRRTYFFDVRSTKDQSELYITITEKKRTDNECEKFKIFIYKEDFDKFSEALKESLDFARKNFPKND